MNEVQQTTEVSPEDLLAQQLYWVNKLSGDWPETALFAEVVELPKGASVFQLYPFELPADVSERIFKSTKRAELSIYSMLVSALTILLYKYTGSGDVVVGSPLYQPNVTGGSRGRLVPLRFQLEGRLQYKDYLLGRVRPTIIEAYGNQDYPFEKVVELLNLAPGDGRSSVIDILVSLENIHDGAGLEDTGNSLTFSFNAHEQGVTGQVKYNSTILRRETVGRLVNHYTNLLRSVLQNVGTTLAQASLLTEDEERELLVGFNQSAAPFPSDRTFPALFEEQAARTPDRIAVAFDGQTHTYAELNARANRVAHRLKTFGVGPEVLVTLLARRDTDLLTAILAVFKAGGAYLPLDPLFAPKRVGQVLSQSKSPLVVVSEELRAGFAAALDDIPAGERPQVLLLEELLRGEGNEENLPGRCAPTNLAYVIYTSGSTGVPKGAMIEHGGMLNHVYAKIADLRLTETDIVAQTASQSFDISVWQFLTILLAGGQVRIVNNEAAHDPQQLFGLVERDSVSILEMVPSLLGAALMQMETIEHFRPRLPALRWLLVTGEAVPPELCRRWLKLYPDVPLLNAYGPTECSDDVTHFPLYEPLAEGQSQTPIGRPVANTQIYILNQTLTPVPLGVPGEIYVGGAGVGRGYLNEPERTAGVFTANPFSAEAGARLYKTGDLGRYHADGNIEFLGRVDQQVKLRGYRIELGEIETVMRHHPGVREAVVLAREDKAGEKRLVAYVVPSPDAALEVADVREFLLERLAEYMVPSAFVVLNALPLSSNGKIDRRKLPAPELTPSELAQEFVEPRNLVEQKLAEIWAEVLRLEQVGVHDNFFELGGDSILSIHIIAKANQAGIRLTPKQMFEYQTISELAAVANTTSAVRAESGMAVGQIPLTPIQHWFFEQNMRDQHHFNQAILLEVGQRLDPSALKTAARDLLAQHDALRLRFERKGDAWQQVAADLNNDSTFTHVDLSGIVKTEQGRALETAVAEAQRSLDLSAGPVMRVTLFHLGGDEADRLLIVIHHLGVDIVSWQILLADLWQAYQQVSEGRSVELPAKTTSFKRWAEQLTEYAKSEELSREVEYWTKEPAQAVTRLPLDFDGGENIVSSVKTHSVRLGEEETRQILQEVPKSYRTQINDVLLTALGQTLTAWTGGGAQRIDLEGHGREPIFEDVDLTRTVGWFSSSFPVVLGTEEGGDAGARLKAVKERLRGVPNGGIGYGLLRYVRGEQEVEGRIKGRGQAEVVFNYGGQFDQSLPESAPFALAKESSGAGRSPRSHRHYLLEINAFVVRRQLTLYWTYSENLHRRETVERVAEGMMAELRAIVAHCQSLDAAGYTPSDFPGAKLSQAELDKFMGKIRRAG